MIEGSAAEEEIVVVVDEEKKNVRIMFEIYHNFYVFLDAPL